MNPQKEDAIKAKAYKEFERGYFADRERKDGKTKAVQLSSEELSDFLREQRAYIDKKYQEAINEECKGRKNGDRSRI